MRAELSRRVAAGLFLALTSCVAATGPEGHAEKGPVTYVFDGDTIVVATEERGERDVRLQGINAPDAGECFYEEAGEFMVDLTHDGPVTLEIVGIDQFDRYLAHVWIGSQHANLQMVREGLAIATTPDQGDPHGEALLAAEEEAARRRLGLWGTDVCGASGPIPRLVVEIVQHDPTGPDEEHLEEEIIAVVNEGDLMARLGGWVVRDESSRHRYVFPTETILDGGERVEISSADPGWDPGGGPVWNNDGDIAMLLDHLGRVVTATRY